jgi:hypothetical protein
MANPNTPEHPTLDPTMARAIDELVGPEGERMEALGIFMGALCPRWDEPGTPPRFDRELFDAICWYTGMMMS